MLVELVKTYLIKLKRSLLYNKLCNHYYLITLFVVLVILSIYKFNIGFIIVGILLLIYILFYYYKIIFFILIIVGLILVNLWIKEVKYNNIDYGAISMEAVVTKIDNNKVTIKSDTLKYIFYMKINDLEVGDVIYIEGLLTQGDINHNDYLFNYREYLKYNNIKGVIKEFNYSKIDHRFTFNSINSLCQMYFNSYFEGQTKGYLEALVIGNKTNMDEEIMNDIQNVGISHLFVISGLHMNILMMIVISLLKLIKVKEKFHFIIVVVFFISYFILTGGLISILRVLLIYIFSKVNKKFNLKLSSFDIYMITIVSLLIINPYYLFSYSFVLTFVISSSLVLINPLLRFSKLKGFFLNNLIISFNSVLVTLPIIININPTINFLSILYNLIYIPFVSYFLLPLSLITCIFPFLSFIYEFVVSCFGGITSILSSVTVFNVSIPYVNVIFYIFYYFFYILLTTCLKHHKMKYSLINGGFLIILMFVILNVNILNIKQEIIFLDLPQGESTLIIDRFNQTNILIDTGEDMGDDLIIYLKKKGIRRLDYIFISHGDSDHNGKLDQLIDQFRIDNIIVNKYDDDTIQLCQTAKYKGNLILVKRGDELKLNNMSFKILLPDRDYNDKNNNSMVILGDIFDTTLLFLGDIEETVEKQLVRLEKNLKVDVLKVPHHGSKTSSSSSLLSNVKYNFAVCMSGYKNTFGFPVDSVIQRYNNRCLTTKDYYTITLYRNNKNSKLSIKTVNY